MNRTIQSLLLCFCFGFFSILITEAQAAPGYGESTPKGPSTDIYALTGTLVTSTTEFSGSIYIYATGASTGLFYDKNTKTLTGQVYSSEIGLIELNSGGTSGISVCPSESNIGTILSDCSIVGKNSNPITLYSPAIGVLTGSINGKVDKNTKMIKDLEFKNVGFTGSILSFSGINLLPKPYHLTGGQFGTGIYLASGSTTIDILQDGIAKAGSLLILTPAGKPITDPDTVRTVYTTSGFQFTGVDLSLAGIYQYSIIDGDGNESLGEILSVAGNVSSTSTSSSTNLIHKYCNNEKTRAGDAQYDRACPDKENLQATQTISDTTTASKKANDGEDNKVKLLLRDEYGNRIYNQLGLLAIDITRTLKDGYTAFTNIPSELNSGVSPSYTGFPGLRINPIDESVNGAWKDTGTTGKLIPAFGASATADPWIQIFSSASGSLKVQWDITTKNISTTPSQDINTISVSTANDIIFTGLINSSSFLISPTSNILRNRESVFSHKYTISDSGAISNPHLEYIITTSSGEIVDRIRSISTNTCEGYTNTGGISKPDDSCGFRNNSGGIAATVNNTLFSTDIPKTNSGTIDIGLTFATGAMTSTGTNTGYLIVMVSYKVGLDNIRYPLINQSFNTAESTGTIPLKILGQIGSSDLGTSMKSLDLLSSNLLNTERDKIRKQAQMMRQDFVSSSTPWTIDGSVDTSKQIYIFEGDIVVKKDIGSKTDKPKVFIALKKSDGTGGNIWIDPSVKDIIASLIADGSIFSGTGPLSYHTLDATDNQLYIYGSVMSNNTVGGKGLNRCPKSIPSCGTPWNYDFENFRGFNGTPANKASTNETASFIIEHDPRLVQDSPLVLMRDLTR